MTRKHLSNETGVRIVLDFLPCFTFDSNHDETLGWKKHKLESRLPGDLNNLRYADDITLTAERKEELKSLLMKVKEETVLYICISFAVSHTGLSLPSF